MQEAVNSVNAKLEEKRNAKEANQNYLDCIPAPLGTWNDSCSYVFHLLKVQGANSTQESCPDIKSIHLICRICIQQVVLSFLLWVRVDGMILIYIWLI